MHLADQAGAHGELSQSFQSGLHGLEVVDDFLDIGARRLVADLGIEDVCQRRLGSLDARRRHRLPAEVGSDEELWVWQQPPGSG